VTSEEPQEEPKAPEEKRVSNWSGGRVIGMVLTSIVGLIGLALLVGGIAILAAYAFARDDDGYFTTDTEQLASSGYAITSDNIDLGVDAAEWVPEKILGDVRIQLHARAPIFAGIGDDADVERYLEGVAGSELTDFQHGDPVLEKRPGAGRPPNPPGEEHFWVAQTEGTGDQTLNWDADFGNWRAVVMNADGSRGVIVSAEAGVKLDWAVWAGLGLLVAGFAVSAAAVAIVLLIGRSASRHSVPAG
jgi:hypothetical protein